MGSRALFGVGAGRSFKDAKTPPDTQSGGVETYCAGGPASIPQADAAAAAVSRWEFLPTHLDGQPIETKMTVHVYFK